ncbi:hypothetical protein PINS_up014125 [Pythium insidiosum]|nr:hypothetical protein PINS_up014125 [Pythium insidiosum]
MASSAGHDGQHAGWIYKQGSLVKNWKRRFMVLRGKQLTYYDTDKLTPRVKEKGSFQVITVELSSDIQNGLLVHGRGGRVLKLYTDSADATSAWYQAIIDATTGAAAANMAALSMSDRYSTLSGSNVSDSVDVDDQIDLMDQLESLPLEDAPPVEHSGWLMKEGSRVKSWKRRYFTLRGDILSYFDAEGTGKNAKGYGHVRGVEVNGEKDNSLDIRFDNGRILRVVAESGEDMQEWLCMLSDAIEAANADHNNVRQSIAVRQSLRLSRPQSRPSVSMPMRHSLAGAPTSRQSFSGMKGSPAVVPTHGFERSQSYQSSRLSFSANSSTISDNQIDVYDSDDSEGDWI